MSLIINHVSNTNSFLIVVKFGDVKLVFWGESLDPIDLPQIRPYQGHNQQNIEGGFSV